MITLLNSTGTSIIFTTETDSNGVYIFRVVPPGNYIVTEGTPTGFGDSDGGDPNSITIDVTSTNSGGNDFVDEQPMISTTLKIRKLTHTTTIPITITIPTTTIHNNNNNNNNNRIIHKITIIIIIKIKTTDPTHKNNNKNNNNIIITPADPTVLALIHKELPIVSANLVVTYPEKWTRHAKNIPWHSTTAALSRPSFPISPADAKWALLSMYGNGWIHGLSPKTPVSKNLQWRI